MNNNDSESRDSDNSDNTQNKPESMDTDKSSSRPSFRTEEVVSQESAADETGPSYSPESSTKDNTTSLEISSQETQPDENVQTVDQISRGGLEGLMRPQEPEEQTQSGQISAEQPVRRGPPKIMMITLAVLVLLGLIAAIAVFFKSRGGGGQTLFGNKGEIVWWGVQEDEGVMRDLINEYQKKNPNVKITYKKQSPKDYRERLTNVLAGGGEDRPDIFEIHNSWIPMFANDLYPIPQEVMVESEYSQIFYPVIVSDLKTQKGIVALPLQYDAITLFINEDIFINAAKTPPKTWNEFRPLVSELTHVDDKKTIIQSGAALGIIENVDYWPEIVGLMLLQNKANPNKPSNQQAIDALEFYRKFRSDFNSWNSSLPKSTVAFANGRLAMYWGPIKSADEITNANSNLRFRTVVVPQLPKEKPSEPDVAYATYWAQGVWTKSTNRDLAWDFLKFLSTPESLQRINTKRKDNNLFERVYPRQDMALLQVRNPVLGSVVEMAPSAKSWYLAFETNDGENGINTQLNKIYAKAIMGDRADARAMQGYAAEIAKILSQYGITVK